MYFDDKNKTYIILDIEGNSSSKVNERKITQFSALLFKNQKCEEINWMNRNVNYINSYVQKLTNISLEKCKSTGMSERNLVKHIHDLLKKVDLIYGYGCKFDQDILKIMFEKYNLEKLNVKWYDVIEDVKKYLSPTKNKLSVASVEYGFNENKFHDALIDCKATYHLMKVIEQIKEIAK